MASVSGGAPKWRSLIDAPVHAVLKNEIDIKIFGHNFGSAGCLQSTKRTNVMLSRARVAQYVVGNWDWVVDRSFAKVSGKLNAYFDEADLVLDKRTDYAIAPTVG
ncbi:uncharacterized protein BDW47DRAFT_89356 [Aspergillus candidus]|uniref:DNA2/NAM7 helicase-like C-terminal domain-containing protein n=1 Tax=Aspergillus candidus TaxID=41067 RepID=A0A2I2FIZ5_ASPCN|nr:hypothetical protein BDW47DRAFT_89356 [Aspergillus candidus]PLB40605.1 hypothetical protein BDW47DRAFT_89356 [Aspergillus candidus]